MKNEALKGGMNTQRLGCGFNSRLGHWLYLVGNVP